MRIRRGGCCHWRDDVVEISSSAWNKLIAEHGRIASIGTRS
jgi:hypothetical protein